VWRGPSCQGINDRDENAAINICAVGVSTAQDYRGWEITIRQQCQQIELELDDSPSLKIIWDEAFSKVWQLALKSVQQDYPNTYFLDRWQFSSDLEPMLNKKFWQENVNKKARH